MPASRKTFPFGSGITSLHPTLPTSLPSRLALQHLSSVTGPAAGSGTPRFSIFITVLYVLQMEVGIEDCLHIEFEYDKAKYHLKDTVVGKIYFLLVSSRAQRELRGERAGEKRHAPCLGLPHRSG